LEINAAGDFKAPPFFSLPFPFSLETFFDNQPNPSTTLLCRGRVTPSPASQDGSSSREVLPLLQEQGQFDISLVPFRMKSIEVVVWGDCARNPKDAKYWDTRR